MLTGPCLAGVHAVGACNWCTFKCIYIIHHSLETGDGKWLGDDSDAISPCLGSRDTMSHSWATTGQAPLCSLKHTTTVKYRIRSAEYDR